MEGRYVGSVEANGGVYSGLAEEDGKTVDAR